MCPRSRRLRSTSDRGPRRVGWLPPLVLLVNLAVLGLLLGYSSLNLRPEVSTIRGVEPAAYHQWIVLLAILAPAVASVVLVWPILRWRRRSGADRRDDGDPAPGVPAIIALRAANAPLALAAFSLLGWTVVTGLAVARVLAHGPDISLGLAAHLVLRPALAGLIAGAATFFGAEYLCRIHVWPVLLASTRIAGNPRLWRVRVSHRLLGLWLAISALPLSAVALTTFTRVAGPGDASVAERASSSSSSSSRLRQPWAGRGSPGWSRGPSLDLSRRWKLRWPAFATAGSTRASR